MRDPLSGRDINTKTQRMGMLTKIMLAAVTNIPPCFSVNMTEAYFLSCNYQCDWSVSGLPLIQGLRFFPS